MASFSDKVKVLIDVDSTGATSGLASFKKSFDEAEGAVGKFKVAGGAAMDFVKQNAASMALAAGAAIATFAAKAIGEFQDLALEVDKFRNVTGLSTDASSRWIEVADDLGIEADSVRNAINKMNREIAGNRDEFEKLGIEIARTNDGAIDVNQTFQNTLAVLRGIKDPTERARVATELFGKQWQSVSELITMGAGEVKAALEGVSDVKIIDENEIEKAKGLRDAQARLNDAFENFTQQIGQQLLPSLAAILDFLADLANQTSGWGRAWNVVTGVITRDAEKVSAGLFGPKSLEESVNAVTAAFWASQEAMYRTRFRGLELADTINILDQDTNGLIDTWDEFLGRLDAEEAWNNLEDRIRSYDEAVKRAFKENTPAAWAATDDARRNAQRGVADYIKQLGTIEPKIQTQILALVEEGSFAEAMRRLDVLARSRTVGLVPILPGDTPSEVRGRRALGGPVSANVPYLVGERGPEMFIPSGSGRISPGMGGTVVVNVAGSVVTENQLVESIRKGLIDAQRNGKQLVFTGP